MKPTRSARRRVAPPIKAVQLMRELRRKLNRRFSKMTRQEQFEYLRAHSGRKGSSQSRTA